MIEVTDLFRIGLRVLHALAGVAWVGGSIFYLMVLNPALEGLGRGALPPGLLAAIGREFQGLVKAAIPVFIVTGAILTFDRFAQGAITGMYIAVLGVKVALALLMFWLAIRMGERRAASGSEPQSAARVLGGKISAPILALILGVFVYVLAIVLKVMYEGALRAGPTL